MELVKGQTITEYADQNDLTLEQRLELFISVCQAVQHAHQKGIIHRDIKPTNVLVTKHDDKAVVKVIDFGVAKALHRPLTEKTLFTGYGQMIGTPLYMSPEQAEFNGLDVDTRSDIYSLGALLYELLTGTTPFERNRLQKASFEELRRIICTEEPAKPSTKISTLGDTASEICRHRQMTLKKLSAFFRGDLDWIVMKCLEKDRSLRYESASTLAKDVRRFLNHEPVEASPPSVLYRLRRMYRKHRLRVGISAAVVVVTIASVIAGWKLYETTRDRGEAIAKNNALEQLQQARHHADAGDFAQAFRVLTEVETTLADEIDFQHLVGKVSSPWKVTTTPAGAVVRVKSLDPPDNAWCTLGLTPLSARTARNLPMGSQQIRV